MHLSRAPGGGDDIEAMLAFLREQKLFRETKIAQMEEAYRSEQE
jgi:hypothetical protein